MPTENHAEAETEDDRTDDQGERGDEAVHHDRRRNEDPCG